LDIKNEANKKCGFCHEVIPSSSRRCPYCGSLLKDGDENEDPVIVTEGNQPEKPDIEYGKTYLDTVNVATEQEQQTPGPLSNGIKVFLTVVATVIPGLGQLAGIIMGIVFMNAENDSDRRSFGVALLIASLIFFLLSCLGCFIALIGASAIQV